jgi:hypothetical protein
MIHDNLGEGLPILPTAERALDPDRESGAIDVTDTWSSLGP